MNKEDKSIMNTDGKKLVVFFSHAGENYNVGYIEKGNTHIIADMITAACKGANTLIGKGLAIQGKVAQENQASAKKSVECWLDSLGMKK